MGDLFASLNCSDLVNCLDFRREASVNTQNLTFDKCGNSKIVEYFSAVLPRISVTVLSNDLIVESID